MKNALSRVPRTLIVLPLLLLLCAGVFWAYCRDFSRARTFEEIFPMDVGDVAQLEVLPEADQGDPARLDVSAPVPEEVMALLGGASYRRVSRGNGIQNCRSRIFFWPAEGHWQVEILVSTDARVMVHPQEKSSCWIYEVEGGTGELCALLDEMVLSEEA